VKVRPGRSIGNLGSCHPGNQPCAGLTGLCRAQDAGYAGHRSGRSDRVLQEFEDTIFGQDQVVVESQRPERVPFDLAAELHLKFDAVAVAYRKAMRASGLAALS
jgi:Vanillate O-demethylase oxygenase C-terminal domain